MAKQNENTYIVDPESTTEMARLIEQSRTLTQAMGGALAGLPNLPEGAQVIDLGCGPGDWVLDAAKKRPDIEVAGRDISRIMIEYATAHSRSQDIPNASFGIMNITEPLDFPDACFDLVNARALGAVLRKEVWPSFIAECTRILKPGGVLRLTEVADFGVTTSVALERLLAACSQILWTLGYGFSADGRSYGLLTMLPHFLRTTNYLNVHTLAYAIDFSAGLPAWADYYRNYELAFQVGKAIWLKAGVITEEEFNQAYRQMFIDMNQADFCGLALFGSVIGEKSG